ncbi:hypothetical protein F2Q69_00001102 [Brassica cretica]|uniref:Uncharacterized protein n=1 Tax=Brassica cretica TaxID=69181 RepID=A0A8S9NQ84_BRACR|nr:hypothetical protein F2Q69_00001102 [Brassica cretica]
MTASKSSAGNLTGEHRDSPYIPEMKQTNTHIRHRFRIIITESTISLDHRFQTGNSTTPTSTEESASNDCIGRIG